MKETLMGIASLLALAALVCAAPPTPLNERQARPSPEWVTRGVMYQIQPRAFTPEGTLKAAQERLPKLADLGVDIIYLCPVFVSDDDPDIRGWSPRQKKSGMNNPRNQYRMKDYYHVDPEYGTDDDLKAFIAESHKLKIRVLLDMVYLHCGPTAVFLAEHPNFVKRDAAGKVAVAAWGFPALNLANPELREYLWKNMEYWVRDFDADGFRCDVADGIPLDFWETARERLEKIRPDVCMLAEGTRREDQLKAFDLDYGWGFKWDNAASIRKQWEKMRDERPRGGARFIRFIDNHDIANDAYDNRIEKAWGTRRVDAALIALFTLARRLRLPRHQTEVTRACGAGRSVLARCGWRTTLGFRISGPAIGTGPAAGPRPVTAERPRRPSGQIRRRDSVSRRRAGAFIAGCVTVYTGPGVSRHTAFPLNLG
jgi:hypothetical protein